MANPQFEELTLEKLETFLLRFSDDRRTGQLRIQGEGARGGRIDLREGMIASVESPFTSESLGDVARKLGFLSKSDLQRAVEALSRSDNVGKHLQDILLDENLLTREGLEACLRYQTESAMHSMIGFHGRISFMPGNVSKTEVELSPREVLTRMRQREHVEEMGTAFLEIVDSGPPLAPGDDPEYEAQAEMRRIAQAAIREAANAAESMQRELEASAAAAPAAPSSASASAPVPAPGADAPSIPAAELDAQAARAAEELLDDAHVAEVAPHELEVVPAPESPDKPRLARVVLEICRPGSSSTDALLEFAVHFAKRAMLFAATSRGLRLAGHKAHESAQLDEEKLKGLLLPADPDGTIGRVMQERTPLRGAFVVEGDADRTLAAAIEPAPEGETILFPIALHDRAIGLLYGDGVPAGDPGLLEDLAAAVATTATVMENKLFARTGKK